MYVYQGIEAGNNQWTGTRSWKDITGISEDVLVFIRVDCIDIMKTPCYFAMQP
jgi:hypothetical protein